ncbi:glutathione S-transferase [Loktanella sp. DSM 29012]|uniref:glutathione S-transferase family protein n=1 Tax=Loktanella sp. DSM 29012 TaxID=1881056 RepID=UPI0008D6B215|nr:glutathione S-transferase family protein [Loktanella sp. DSM 29012]SEP68489.1 glutathione S-transferase [Loktanella sp. DSM 29012]
MQLLYSPASPFARKCRVLLREANLLDAVQEVNVSTTPFATDAAVAAANPIGKIPALLRLHGPALYDSRVITRFLDDHGNAGLYPHARLWDTLILEATADGIMEAALAITYEGRMRPDDKQWPEWTDAQWAKVARALDAVEDRWISHLSGPLDMGQIAMGCALGYLDLRHDSRKWRAGRDALAGWHATFRGRTTMIDTAATA